MIKTTATVLAVLIGVFFVATSGLEMGRRDQREHDQTCIGSQASVADIMQCVDAKPVQP